jgi:hypothetical protein
MTSRAIGGTVAPPQRRHNDNAIEHTQCVIVNPVLPCRERHLGGLSVKRHDSFADRNNGASFAARDESIDAGRDALAEVGDPESCDNSREDIHGVMRP